MPMNPMDILSKLKQRVSRLYKNFALQVFLFRITLRVAAKTSYRELIQSRTSSRTASSGIQATRWAEELVEQCAAFPNGAHDDLVDCTTLALMRFRQGGFLSLHSDFEEEPDEWSPRPKNKFY